MKEKYKITTNKNIEFNYLIEDLLFIFIENLLSLFKVCYKIK